MRHHRYNPEFKFVRDPENFDKYTPRALLQYCLGATMYMPGTRDFAKAIVRRKYPGLTSFVMCFEDACRAEDVPGAEINAIHMLDELNESLASGDMKYEDLPLIIFRVRSVEQFRHFSAMLRPEHVHLVTAINFPKFNTDSASGYLEHLREINAKFGEKIYGMPIIEDRRVAMKETRMDELLGIKHELDACKDLVLNVRVGATDFSS